MDKLEGFIEKELYKNFCEGYKRGALDVLESLRHTMTDEQYIAYKSATERAVHQLRKGGNNQ